MGKTLSEIELERHFVSYQEYSKSTSDVFNESDLFSVVFFLLLKQCQSIYTPEKRDAKDVPEKIQKIILASFTNISQLIHGISIEQRSNNSYIQVIWFLHELQTQSKDPSYEIKPSDLGASSAALLEVLGDISFIFDLEENGNSVFPINQLIASIISKKEFITSKLPPEKIQILQLAVRLFTTGERKQILDELRSSCNLGFLDYLGPESVYIDSQDKLNYRKNKTMIFYREEDKSVLVRSENLGYFVSIPFPPEYEKIEEETDASGHVIGRYVTYNLDKDSERTSFVKEIRNIPSATKLLALLFDQKALNIFIDGCIVKQPDGTLLPINRWCSLDEWIIREAKEAGTSFSSTDLRKVINEYRLCPAKQSPENKLNILTFGLCVLLLSSANIGVESLELECLDKSGWYQTQVLKKWLQNGSVSAEARRHVLAELQEQLEYCQSENTLLNAGLLSRDFLPVRLDLPDLYPLFFPYISDHILLLGEIDEGGDSVLVNARKTVSGKKNISELQGKTIPFCLLRDPHGIIEQKNPGTQFYFFYSVANNSGQIEDQIELGVLSGIEQIEANYVMDKDVGLKVYSAYYSIARERMKMYEKAFVQKAIEGKVDIAFDTQIAIRLLHNMLFYNISPDQVAPYFEVMAKHDIADFSGIEEDPSFYKPAAGTLYVPKDKVAAGATLADIFNDISDATRRNPACIFEQNLTFDGCKYGINNNPITNIVFLTDNFISGTSTIATLSAYLNLSASEKMPQERIDKAKDKMHCYMCGKKVVTIGEIIDINAPASITVRAYYGTEAGKTAIEQYLKDYGYGEIKVEYRHELKHTCSEIVEQLKHLGWNYEERWANNYIVIRKHNMPKWSVYKSETLNANKVISMFIKRWEL